MRYPWTVSKTKPWSSFNHAKCAQDDVEAGRRFVRAYVNLIHYTPDGGDLIFAFALGSTAQDNPAGARFDRTNGDVLLAGEFSGRVDLDPSAGGVALFDSGDPLVVGDARSDLVAARSSPIGRFRSARVLQTGARDRLAHGAGLVADDRILAISNNYFPSSESQQIYFFQPSLPRTT